MPDTAQPQAKAIQPRSTRRDAPAGHGADFPVVATGALAGGLVQVVQELLPDRH